MSKNRDFRQLSRSKSAALSHDSAALSTLNFAVVADTSEQRGDQGEPALVIGLTLASVKQGQVPELLLLHLSVLANSGNAACKLVKDWIEKRAARELVQRSKAEIIAASAGGADE